MSAVAVGVREARPLPGSPSSPVFVASWDVPTHSINIAAHGPPLQRWDSRSPTARLATTAYLGGSCVANETQDALVALDDDTRLVLAIADGVTPTSRTPAVDDRDGARFAALHVLELVSEASSATALEEVFLRANASLFSRFAPDLEDGTCPRDLPQAAAAAVEVRVGSDGNPRGVRAVRAGDCDVWWRTGSSWTLSHQSPMLKDEVLQWLALWDMKNPTASCEQRVREETRWLNDPNYWNTTALGRFEQPKIEHFDVPSDVDELVLVTDGAQFGRFVETDGSDLDAWMRQLRTWEHVRTCDAPRHNDVALLRLRLASPP